MAEAPISARPHVFYVRPAPGWLELVHEEVMAVVQTPLQKYKYEPKVTQLQGTIKVHRCDWRQGLEILQRLTTAHDVEWLILESNATKWPDVDAVLGRVPWDEILPNKDVPIHVTAETDHAFTTSSGKIRDNLCKIARVKHVSEGANFRFKAELRGELLRVLVSLAGNALYKRGYKEKFTAVAPLPEHQAAACANYVMSENESPIGAVFAPMAGSGTLGFESLVVLAGAGSGSFNREFACEKFPCVSNATMGFIRRKLVEKLKTATLPPVMFNDFNDDAVSALKENIAVFPAGTFTVNEGDVFGMRPEFPAEGKILILVNPPFGDRLAPDASIPTLYAKLGKYFNGLAAKHPGRILGGCLCPDELTWKKFLSGLEVETPDTHHFTHGGKEMRIVRWQA